VVELTENPRQAGLRDLFSTSPCSNCFLEKIFNLGIDDPNVLYSPLWSEAELA